MAHANPEFALARQFMQSTPGPVSAERREIPTARDLAKRMDRILSQHPAARSPENAALADAFIAGARHCRPRRADHCSFELFGATPREDRPKRGERFVEPKRRVPLDVQRDKLPGAW